MAQRQQLRALSLPATKTSPSGFSDIWELVDGGVVSSILATGETRGHRLPRFSPETRLEWSGEACEKDHQCRVRAASAAPTCSKRRWFCRPPPQFGRAIRRDRECRGN